MKGKTLQGVALLLVLSLMLSGCTAGVSQEDYDAVVAQRNIAQTEQDAAQAQRDVAQAQVATLQSDLTAAQAQIQALQSDYDKAKEDLREGIEQSNLENPSWSELEEFLRLDDTDKLLYNKDSFDCTGFAITLRDHASRYGIRCAFVEVGFFAGDGHALNAFETTDKGLVYVDTTEDDKIAYVGINQPYGTIHLDAVKFEYIVCSGDPAEFWAPLTYDTHPNPFSYDYYTDYQRRREFCEETMEAYNTAVDDYNQGSTKWSDSTLTAWLANFEALEEDLGSHFFEAGGVVKSIQIYWN